MKDLRVLGSLASSEFRSPFAWLMKSGRCDFFDSSRELIGAQTDVPPSLIVIAQSMRGQFRESIVGDLQNAFPNTRLLLLVGSWCEGETRSGLPLPDVERVYAAESVVRMKQILGQAPADQDPATSNAIVVSHNDCFAESVVEAIVASGGDAVAVRSGSKLKIPRANVVIYDAHPNQDRRSDEVERLHRQWGLPLIALVDFPRGFEIDSLGRLGVSSVLPKPFAVDDLLSLMDEHVAFAESQTVPVVGSLVTERESAA